MDNMPGMHFQTSAKKFFLGKQQDQQEKKSDPKKTTRAYIRPKEKTEDMQNCVIPIKKRHQ